MQVLNTICTKHCTKSCMKHELSCMILLHAWTHMFMHEPMLNLFSLHDSEGTCTFLDHNLVQNHKIMWFHALSCTFMQEVAGSCTYLENHARLAYPIDFCPIRTFILESHIVALSRLSWACLHQGFCGKTLWLDTLGHRAAEWGHGSCLVMAWSGPHLQALLVSIPDVLHRSNAFWEAEFVNSLHALLVERLVKLGRAGVGKPSAPRRCHPAPGSGGRLSFKVRTFARSLSRPRLTRTG